MVVMQFNAKLFLSKWTMDRRGHTTHLYYLKCSLYMECKMTSMYVVVWESSFFFGGISKCHTKDPSCSRRDSQSPDTPSSVQTSQGLLSVGVILVIKNDRDIINVFLNGSNSCGGFASVPPGS